MDEKELKSIVEKGVAPVLDEAKAATAKATAVEETVKSVDERLKKIEALPAVSHAPAVIRPSEFKGYKLGKCLAGVRNLASREPAEFSILSNDEKAEEMAKFFILLSRVIKGKAIKQPDIEAMAELRAFYQKTALNEGTDAQGAYLVPEEYRSDMIKIARNSSYALQVTGPVIPMNSDTMHVPVELTHGSVTWEDEAAQKTASEPTFSEVKLTAKKMFCLAAASNEIIADSEIDIASILYEQFAYAMGQELDNQMFNGTGSPCSGVLTAAAGYSVAVPAGASFSTVSALQISQAIQKLQEGYLQGARFFFGRVGMHYIRSLKDTTGRPIYNELGATTPKTLYDYPINLSEKLPSATDTSSTVQGVFGNFKYFVIGSRKAAMTIDVDPYSLFTYDKTQFRMVTRWGMSIAIANAFCRIMNASA